MTRSLLILPILLAGLTACTTVSDTEKKNASAPAQKQNAAPEPVSSAKKLSPAEQKREQERAAAKANLEKEAALRKKAGELKNFLWKQKGKHEEKIVELKKMLADPQYSEKRFQHMLLEQIVRICRTFGWQDVPKYDFTLPDRELEPAALAILNSKDFTYPQKRHALSALAGYYCDKKDFAKAEKLVRDFLAQKDMSKEEQIYTLMALANVFKLQDRYDDAVKVFRDVEKLDPVKGRTARADIAKTFGKEDDFAKVMVEIADPYEKIMYYVGKQSANIHRYAPMESYGNLNWANDWVMGPKGQKMAIDFVKNPANSEKKRVEVGIQCLFWFYGSKETDDARRSLASCPSLQTNPYLKITIAKMIQTRNYDLAAELCDMCTNAKIMSLPEVKKHQVLALGALKRDTEAAKIAAEFAERKDLKPADRLTFKLYASILSGSGMDDILKDPATSAKEKAEAIFDAGQKALAWQKNDAAETLAARYADAFADKIQKTLPVRYFSTPVNTVSDWRKIYSKLEKQYCDVKFRVNLDMLANDVGTGRGSIVMDEKAKQGQAMEITALCDPNGLHVFLRMKDEKAQQVRYGFAPGCVTESYIAPGRNQPYTCFGTDPISGITYVFGTVYNHKNQRKLDKTNGLFTSETQFTDEDYVQHLFFSWENFFDKLPDNGTEYRYECIAFSPNGPYSWGGSHGVHASSKWGSLKFELSAHQVNEIRKSMIFKTFRSYKMVQKEMIPVNLFTYWADVGIGDPDFYRTVLAPLEKELDSYAALVKPDMPDSDVEKVYTRALPRMKGLADEIDQLRRQYLQKQIIQAGK